MERVTNAVFNREDRPGVIRRFRYFFFRYDFYFVVTQRAGGKQGGVFLVIVHRDDRCIFRGHRIERRAGVLGHSKGSRLDRNVDLFANGFFSNGVGISFDQHVRTHRRIRGHHLANAIQPSRDGRFIGTSVGASIIGNYRTAGFLHGFFYVRGEYHRTFTSPLSTFL